jgi:RNA polymerase sigma-70 factor, ECF subfamily
VQIREEWRGAVSDFHLLLEEEIPKLVRYASALTRDVDEAGELVEDTVRQAMAEQRAWQRQHRDNTIIRVWLLTILHDLRSNPFRQMNGQTASTDNDPKASLTLSQLDRALGQLPEKQRAAILLIGLEGMSYPDTAAILRISASTMRSRLTRGRAHLRQLMGVDSAAAARAAA